MICFYYLTYNCESQCAFCGIWQDEDLKDIQNSDAPIVKKNLSDLKDLQISRVYFTGGEPLLHNAASEIIAYAKNIGLQVSVFSNGEYYMKKADELENNIDYLYLPIDSPLLEIHDEIRGRKSYQNTLAAIDKANSKNIQPIINFTMTRSTIQYLPEMVELSQTHNALLNINPVYGAEGLEGFENTSCDYILRYQKIRNVFVNRAMIQLIKMNGNSIKKPVCFALDTAITISPDDHLILPCFVNKQAHVPIEGRLKAVYNSDIVKGYKKLQGRLDKCEKCMCSDYIVPSFNKKINKYYFLNLISKKIQNL